MENFLVWQPYLRRPWDRQKCGTADNQRPEFLPDMGSANPIEHAFRSSSAQWNIYLVRRRPFDSQLLSWTSRRKRVLSKRSCLLARTTPLSYWTAWAFQNPLRESGSTLRSRRGFCFLSRNSLTIGYQSIKCECFFPSCSGVFSLCCWDSVSINRVCRYQTLAERTPDPFTDQARAVPPTDQSLVHSYRT